MTTATPIAWRKLVDSAFTLHPEWTYTDQQPTTDLDKWEPLYAAALAAPDDLKWMSELADAISPLGFEYAASKLREVAGSIEDERWKVNVRDLLDRCKHAIRVCEGGGPESLLLSLVVTFQKMQAEIERLEALINTPHINDFFEAVKLEAAHQRERWGVEHDAGKTDADWFWLIGYLAGKAIRPDVTAEKRLHHIITTAAACLNWHMQKLGVDTRMRPGIAPPKG